VSSLTDPSERPGGQLDVAPDTDETRAPVNDELQNGAAEQKPSGARSRKHASTSTPPGTAKAATPKLSKADKRPPLRFHLIGGADVISAEARSVLESLDDPPLEVIDGPPQVAASGNGDRSPEIAGVVVEGREADWFEEIHKLDQSSPRPVVLALITERSSALMRRALRAGADEVLFMPLDPSDITRALLKVTEAHRRSEHGSLLGRVCSFVSLTGGAGVTTLSGGLALALSYQCRKRVGLVDLNLQSGGLSVFLNLDPEHTMSLLIDERRALDSIQLESTLTRHASGLHLLAAPKRVEESEGICETTVTAVLDLMRQLFDFVVVDCGSQINENVAAAWERSDQLFYVVDQSIAAARSAVRFMDLFSRLQMEVEPAFILNRYDARRPVTEELISRTLARPLDAKIASDDTTIERSQVEGRDLWQTSRGSVLVRNLEEFARKMVGDEPSDENGRHNGLVARIFSAFGRRS
jgi:pilus assembly protein CpaE